MTKPKRMDELVAAYNCVDSFLDRADEYRHAAPLWHGWALREAYLEGLAAGRKGTCQAEDNGHE